MCGLVGMAGDLKYRDEATMRKLLLLDYLRGTDSTGLAAIGRDYTTTISKVASHPIDLFDSVKFRSALTGATSHAFIGHNRAATRGAVNAANAHPYEYKHIVGAHNGTLDSASWQRLEGAVGEKFGTDSNAIFAAIADLGIEETLKLMEEGANSSTGAWALVWYDGKAHTLNFLKNKHRPLYIGNSKDGDLIMWASEWEMIDYATRVATPKYEYYTDKDDACFFPLPDNELHSYDLEKLAASTDGPFVPEIFKNMKGRAPMIEVKGDPFGRDVDGWDREWNGTMGFHNTGGTNSTTTSSRGTNRVHMDCLNIDGSPDSPYAGFVSKPDFDTYSRGGCSWCKQPIKYEDTGTTVFEKESHILCPDCSVSDATRIYITSKVFNSLY